MKNWIFDSKKYFLFLLLILSTFTIGNHETYITNLSGQYLLRSVNLFINNEFTEFSRGPLYPLIVNLFYYFFGINFKLAVFIHYSFYLFSIILIYLISQKIYDSNAAFLAVLITVLSPNLLDVALSVEVAFIYSTFILLSLWFLLNAFETKSSKFFVFSGISIALGFLTKEIILFYLLCPFLILFFKKFRNKFYVKGLFLYILSFIILILPWVLLAYKNDSLISLLGEFRSNGGANISFYGYSNFIYFIFNSLIVGFLKSLKMLASHNELAILYVFSFIYFFIYDFIIRKNFRIFHFLIYVVVAFSLLAPFGMFLDGFRQITINILLLNILVSIFLIDIIKKTRKSEILKKFSFKFILIFLFLLPVTISLVKSTKLRFDNFQNFIINIEPIGRMNSDLISLSKRISEEKNKSLCFNFRSDHSLMYLTELNYEYIRPKLFSYIKGNDLSKTNFQSFKDDIIQVKFHPSYKSGEYRHLGLEILYKKDLLNYFLISKKSNCLIIIDRDIQILENFLDTKNLIFSDRYKLYKIDDYRDINYKIDNYDNSQVIEEFLRSDYINYLKKNFKENYNSLNKLR